MVRWTFPPTFQSRLVPCTEHVLLHSCLSVTTTGFLFTAQTKCCLSCFLCGGDERRMNTWEMIMFPRCGGTGDYVVIPSSTSVSMKCRLLTLQKAKETCLGRERKKELCFVLQCLYLQSLFGEPQSITRQKLSAQWLTLSQGINKHIALTFKFWGLSLSLVQEWSSQISCCWWGDVDALLGITWFISFDTFLISLDH